MFPLLVAALLIAAAPARAETPLPERLVDTGFGRVEALPFEPQYPLWSDGAAKRRWLHLPSGTAIDARDPDHWVFPAGTRLWKEFAIGGRPVETRFIERLADGRWRYSSYVWDAAGRSATLAPERGALLDVPGAPGVRYGVPSRADCTACHDSEAAPVLGASALQLSPAREGSAPAGAVDVAALVARGWLRGLPASLRSDPPRIAAAGAEERAALGYLHGNCGHCHRDGGVPVPLRLAQSAADPAGSAARVRASLLEAAPRWRPAAVPADARLIVPGRPEASLLLGRLQTTDPLRRMPPLGTRVPDAAGIAALTDWINHPLLSRKDPQP